MLLSPVRLFVTPWSAPHQLPCPSLSPGVCSNTCPLSRWCHPTISSCLPFFLLPSIFLSIQLFSYAKLLFAPCGQNIGASAQVLPNNIQDWFPFRLISLIFLLCKGLSTAPQFESINSLLLSLLYGPTLTSVHGVYNAILVSMKWYLIVWYQNQPKTVYENYWVIFLWT